MPLKLFKSLPNFELKEFHCKDGTPVPVELHSYVVRLATNLQVLRDELKVPIVITSAYRTRSHNKNVNGALNSHHLMANAVDFRAIGLPVQYVAFIIHKLMLEERMAVGGLGIYKGFIHYDLRGHYHLFKY